MSTPFDRHEMVRICREHGIGREAFLKVKPLVLAAAERDTALLRQALEVLSRAHQTAMEQTLRARVPECSAFGWIAQDLDFVVAALRERLGEKT